MGAAASEIDDWLRGGGVVVASSDRAARAAAAWFHRARRNEGATAWLEPEILNWNLFVENAWGKRTADSRLLLNPAQELALWMDILSRDHSLATLLEGPRRRMAALAKEAHERLCAYAPQYLEPWARRGWQQDAAAFSGWLAHFDQSCLEAEALPSSRLPLELIALLEADSGLRPPLLLLGLDRIQPTQRRLLDRWGEWREIAPGKASEEPHFYAAGDAQAELHACVRWAGMQLAANPEARLLVVTQEARTRRGVIERAFLKLAAEPIFEFSLGIPLRQVALARSAHLLLRWLAGALEEQQVDWLIASGHAVADAGEAHSLQALMRTLRRNSRERTHWTLEALLAEGAASKQISAAWAERMRGAARKLEEIWRRRQTPLEWAEFVPRLLQWTGWPGTNALSSAEHQAIRRWQQTVDAAGSLGFDGRRMSWSEFFSELTHSLDETLFAPESTDPSIQIAGPAESAGLAADAVWFLGAEENAWPASGTLDPLLPADLQREAGMPHSSAQLDWDLARSITARLLSTAPAACFSFARQSKTAEARPSRLVAQLAAEPQPLPAELQATAASALRTVTFEDFSRPSFAAGKARGGSSVLTAQSLCPFKAFATVRLAARGWNPAESGLTASRRGQLLHDVLHAIWSGPPAGIRSLEELLALADRRAFVAEQVHRVLRQQLHASLRDRMPRRYLELEAERLTGLVTEWLDFEATRVPFEVAETELKRTETIAGLALDLRLDRVDRLNDGSLLVIDYKSGEVSPKSWELPRPEDVQLPLYAGFGLDGDLGGLVFAKVRAGEHSFAGRVGDARATLLANLTGNSALVRNPLTAEDLLDWREQIEKLARAFVDGHAEVDPRPPAAKTCERCELHCLCRIYENQVDSGLDASAENGEELTDE